jgi:ankyrin repeat protein
MRRFTPIACLLVAAGSIAGCHRGPESRLAIAAAAGRADEMRELIAAGADVDAADASGITALAWAARFGQPTSIDVLLASGAAIDLPCGTNDWTPLMHAVHKNRNEAARALLRAGASIRGRHGKQALAMAAGYGNADLVQTLLDAGAAPDPDILVAAVGGAWDIDYQWTGCEPHTATVRALLAAAPGLRMPDDTGSRSALRYARKKGCTEMLALVEGGGEARASVDSD